MKIKVISFNRSQILELYLLVIDNPSFNGLQANRIHTDIVNNELVAQAPVTVALPDVTSDCAAAKVLTVSLCPFQIVGSHII